MFNDLIYRCMMMIFVDFEWFVMIKIIRVVTFLMKIVS